MRYNFKHMDEYDLWIYEDGHGWVWRQSFSSQKEAGDNGRDRGLPYQVRMFSGRILEQVGGPEVNNANAN